MKRDRDQAPSGDRKYPKVDKELFRLVFTPISTGDFKFDVSIAASVLKKVATGFLNQHRDVELIFVQDQGQQQHFVPSESFHPRFVIQSRGFSSVFNDVKALAVATGCGHRLGRPGENEGNVCLHKEFNKRETGLFSRLCQEQCTNILPKQGSVHKIKVPESHHVNFKWVLLVLGPNTNPERANCVGDYTEAKSALEISYRGLFDAFRALVSKLPRSGFLDSIDNRFGLGTLPLGVNYPTKRPSKEEAREIIERALDLGVQFIDTADTYSNDQTDTHYMEQLISQVTAKVSKKVVIATKGGMFRVGSSSKGWRMRRIKKDTIFDVLKASYDALGGKEPVNLWQLHHIPSSREAFQLALEDMKRALDEGLVEYLGLCNCTVDEIEFARSIVPIAAVENEFSLWNRIAEKPRGTSKAKRPMCGVLPYCQSNNIAFIAHGALGGLQSRDGRRSLIKRVPELESFAQSLPGTISPHTACLVWMTNKWSCMLHIIGTRSIDHLEDVQKNAPGLELDNESMCKLDKIFC
mmetsp:Transcript_25055/g.40659  ORF Transcript_25055/g.40659 Transcript_25055/m.40659 type:complete len:523 (-) Transcript_25055:764-2332(-)|eukprot:CAMPEP_0203747538 /NCGR_PEP_ID=MMETSP0098-20131031/2658_1 /ASSEMBLY_ACC=CAM_ASM_000208 /TAXON_ID=96639 /ORGANISM=" , Strain NY0313808BC1" /LENGTH=522 /DNA_ID=CAMNT_0050635987 /DNA_START=172 /DNA_END=1740 /DNA_ORIENTATION=+